MMSTGAPPLHIARDRRWRYILWLPWHCHHDAETHT